MIFRISPALGNSVAEMSHFSSVRFSYSMTGKLGGHAGPVMTVLLRETNRESLVFTGSRDHYVKVSIGKIQWPSYDLCGEGDPVFQCSG